MVLGLHHRLDVQTISMLGMLSTLCQQFRYINRARWNLSTSMDPVPVILSMSMLLMVFTANCALQLAYRFATYEILC